MLSIRQYALKSYKQNLSKVMSEWVIDGRVKVAGAGVRVMRWRVK